MGFYQTGIHGFGLVWDLNAYEEGALIYVSGKG